MALESTGKVPRDLQTLFRSGRIGDLSDGALLERFLAAREEGAFEALVERHGPMVLRVCRATLADPTDVDDAFQAVFLILFRKSAAIQSRASVASWLHGVALRVSARANVDAARRRKHERNAAERPSMTATEPAGDPNRAASALHEEVARLPDRYREAVVLYYFESQTCEEAARRIGRPLGTVKARLARARGLLKQRLARRGIALPAVVIAADAEAGAAPPVPPELASATTRSIATSAEVPTRVRLLAQGVIGSMQLQTIKLIGACCLMVGLGVGAIVATRQKPAPRDDERGSGGKVSTDAPPVVASRPPEYDTVRLALGPALAAGTKAADPYTVTFALIGLAKAQNAAGDRDSALKTFAEADRVAGTVPGQHLRRLALLRTAVARGQAGDKAPARATLERFVREGAGLGAEARYNLMSMVIGFLYQAGFQDDARATLKRELAAVEAIDDDGVRDGGIYRLHGTQLTLGDYDGALRQAARYTGERSNDRASLLQDIMRSHGANDARPSKEVARRALELSREITFPYPRAQAQSDIAAALARAGDIAGGLAVAREIGETRVEPFQIIRWSEFPRALVEIARAQAKAGALAAAIATLGEARSAALEAPHKDSLCFERVRKVAEAQLEVGDLAGAKISAAAIESDDVEKALALAALARAQAKAGDRQAADATLHEAHARALAIRAPRANLIGDNPVANAHRVFREIALAEAETGDAKAALATVAGHGPDAWRSPVLAEIALIQARKGDAAGALATAASIADATLGAEAYRSIAAQQARSGDPLAALEWASRLEAPTARAFALIGITEGIVAARPATPASGTPRP